MTSVHRLQMSFNSSDAAIIKSGLEEFITQMKTELGDSYGYNGRMVNSNEDSENDSVNIEEMLHPKLLYASIPPACILSLYLKASPRMDELFALWKLSETISDNMLYTMHVSALSFVLHFNRNDEDFCNDAITRILSDHLSLIMKNLSSGNIPLIHATLGLLITMSRSSSRNCQAVYQKIYFSASCFTSIVQKGKLVSSKTKTKDQESVEKTYCETDSRLLLIILLLVLIESIDESQLDELLSGAKHNSIVQKVTHSVNKDRIETLDIIFRGLLYLLKTKSTLQAFVSKIIDSICIQKMLIIYDLGDDELDRQYLVHTFLVDFCQMLAKLAKGGNGASYCTSQLAPRLKAYKYSRHRELQSMLLLKQPHLVSKCIANITSISSEDGHGGEVVNKKKKSFWEPSETFEYISIINYLTHLANTIPIDSRTKNTMKGIFTKSSLLTSNASDELMQTMIPPGMFLLVVLILLLAYSLILFHRFYKKRYL